MLKLYGIKNCDSVKKACTWLEQQGLAYEFHDFKTEGLSPELLHHFIHGSSVESLLNRRSTTWKQLADEHKSDLDLEKTTVLLLAMPTLIKRPVLDTGMQIMVGFEATEYTAYLKN